MLLRPLPLGPLVPLFACALLLQGCERSPVDGASAPGATGLPAFPPPDGGAAPGSPHGAMPPHGLPASSAAPLPESDLEGEVLETFESAGFTYARLKPKSGAEGEVWTATTSAVDPPKVGQTLKLTRAVRMHDFHSRSLNRTFPEIWFGERSSAPAPTGASAAPSSPAVSAAPGAPGAPGSPARAGTAAPGAPSPSGPSSKTPSR